MGACFVVLFLLMVVAAGFGRVGCCFGRMDLGGLDLIVVAAGAEDVVGAGWETWGMCGELGREG